MMCALYMYIHILDILCILTLHSFSVEKCKTEEINQWVQLKQLKKFGMKQNKIPNTVNPTSLTRPSSLKQTPQVYFNAWDIQTPHHGGNQLTVTLGLLVSRSLNVLQSQNFLRVLGLRCQQQWRLQLGGRHTPAVAGDREGENWQVSPGGFHLSP